MPCRRAGGVFNGDPASHARDNTMLYEMPSWPAGSQCLHEKLINLILYLIILHYCHSYVLLLLTLLQLTHALVHSALSTLSVSHLQPPAQVEHNSQSHAVKATQPHWKLAS